MLAVRLPARRGWASAAVLAGYAFISFAYWGVRLLRHPGRVYIGAAVITALWTATAQGRLRVVLPALAVLALVPDVHLGFWQTQA